MHFGGLNQKVNKKSENYFGIVKMFCVWPQFSPLFWGWVVIKVIKKEGMCVTTTLIIHFLHKCFANLIEHRALFLPMPTSIANCCFRIGGCPAPWPAWLSYLFLLSMPHHFELLLMHENMQVLSRKTCVGGILFKGKLLGEVPMAILELLEFPEKRAQSCTPILCS